MHIVPTLITIGRLRGLAAYSMHRAAVAVADRVHPVHVAIGELVHAQLADRFEAALRARRGQALVDHPGRAVDGHRALDLARRRLQLDGDVGDRDVGRQLGAGADRLADDRRAAALGARGDVADDVVLAGLPGATAAPPAASTAQQPAVTASLEVAAAPPPTRCRTPASGPMPIGGISARRRLRAAFRLSRNSLQAPQVFRCRSACSDGRRRSSWAVSRTSRIAAQSASRASAAATSPVRARLTSCREAAGEISSALRDLVVAEPVELAHQQRRALLLGQVGEVLDQPSQLVAAAQRRVDVLARTGTVAVGELGGGEPVAAQLVDAEVAHDAVQPRLELDRPAVVAQRAVRAQERLLDDPLGVAAVAAQGTRRGRVQAPPVALVQRLERVLAPRAEERDEVLVRAQLQRCWSHRFEASPRHARSTGGQPHS